MIWRAPSAVLLAALVCACPKKPAPQQDPNVVAVINGELIPRQEFERELGREVRFTDSSNAVTSAQLEIIKTALLNTLIERSLLLQVARQQGLTSTSEEVDRRLLRISSDYPAERFNEALAQGDLTLPELRQKTAALMLIEKLFEQDVYSRVAVTEEQLRQYFEEHKAEFQEPEQVHAAQIVVKDLDDARRIQHQLQQGKRFADLARKYSLSADARVGGDLGFFPRGTMPPQFDEVAFKLGVGQTSDVVSTEYGYHLFKVLDRRPARHRDFGEVRGQVEQQLLKLRKSEAQAEYVKGLRQRAEIRVNEEALASILSKSTQEGEAAQH